MNLQLLYIEDNDIIRKRVAETLRESSFGVKEVATAADAKRAFAEENFDLVLLDILLPDGNGIDLLRELRHGKNTSVPVIILSALGEEIDERVSGLDAGANDYLAKPFSVRELIARIRAVMRSTRPATENPVPGSIPLNGGKLDLRQPYIIRDDGTRILLTMKEFYLLRYFAENRERVISVEEIISRVWKLDPLTTNTYSPIIFISRLRNKLGDLCEIKAKRGNGYSFNVP